MDENVQVRPSERAERASHLYHVLLLTPEGHVVRTQGLVALSDDQALRLALSMVDGHAVDLWDGLRFIEHFDAKSPVSMKQPWLLRNF